MIPDIVTDIDFFLTGIAAQTIQDIELGMVYKYDFETGDFVVVDGKPMACTPVEAVKQWAELCIRTPANQFRVYDGTAFGCGIVEQLINRKSLPADYVNSAVYAELSEKMLTHKLISDIQDFKITNTNGVAEISYTLITTLGEIEGGVTINVI